MNRRHFLRNGLWVAGASIFVPRLVRAQYMPMADPHFLARANNESPKIAVEDFTTGIVGWWKLDDGSGDTAADSGGSNTGTLANTPTWVAGKNGGALSFNGSDQYVYASSPVGGNSVATLAGWMYRSATNVKVSFGLGTQANYRFNMLWFTDNNLYLSLTNSVYQSVALSGTGWNHLVFVFNGGLVGNARVALYVNGSAASLTYNGVIASVLSSQVNLSQMWIGREAVNGYCAGVVDDVRLYNSALSASEAARVFGATS